MSKCVRSSCMLGWKHPSCMKSSLVSIPGLAELKRSSLVERLEEGDREINSMLCKLLGAHMNGASKEQNKK